MLQIIYSLTGENSFPPIVDRQMGDFVHKLRDEIEDLIWEVQLRGSAAAKLLFDAYQGLSDTERARFFLSPQGFQALRTATAKRSPEAIELLARAVAHSLEALPPSPLETLAETDLEDREVDQVLIGETVALDLGSSWGRRLEPTSPVFFLPYERPSPSESRTIADKLSAALAEIDAAAPAFGRMIRNYTRTIVVRKVGSLPPASEQVDTELGAIRLRNVHLDAYAHDQLVDDLIHESTHNFLGTFEYLRFPFVPYGERAGGDVRPVSPWSMRPIQVLPFLHAVFVYFAMLNYANRRLSEATLSYEMRVRLQRRRNRYASGFLMPGRLRSHVSSLTKVDPRVLDAIDSMQNIVRSMSDASRTKELDEPHTLALVA